MKRTIRIVRMVIGSLCVVKCVSYCFPGFDQTTRGKVWCRQLRSLPGFDVCRLWVVIQQAAEAEREKPFIGWKPIALEAVTENHKKKAPGMLESQLEHWIWRKRHISYLVLFFLYMTFFNFTFATRISNWKKNPRSIFFTQVLRPGVSLVLDSDLWQCRDSRGPCWSQGLHKCCKTLELNGAAA